MAEELSWVDYAKAFCMFIVYVNHAEIYYNHIIPFAGTIYRPFFVNLFFIISGYLFFRKYFTDSIYHFQSGKLKSNVRIDYLSNVFYKLAIPTILFSLFIYFPKKIIRNDTIDLHSLLMDTIGGGSMWFTCAMVVAQFILFIMMLRRRSMTFYFVVSLILLFVANILYRLDFHVLNSFSFPWFWKSGFIAVFYMVLGGLYWKYEVCITTVLNKYKMLIPLLFGFYMLLVMTSNDIKCNTINADVNFLGVCSTCMSSLLLISVFKICKPLKFIKFIGRNSIGFYFLSGSIPNVLAIVFSNIRSESSSWVVILISIISFCIAYIGVYIIVRFVPFLFDLRKLNR